MQIKVLQIHFYAICGTTAAPPNAATASEIQVWAVSNTVSQSPARKGSCRGDRMTLSTSEIHTLERTLSESIHCIETLFLDTI